VPARTKSRELLSSWDACGGKFRHSVRTDRTAVFRACKPPKNW
jgi:hypothetical protein